MPKTVPFKILIADDDTDDLDFMKFLFEQHEGFQLLDSLTNGRDVLDYITAKSTPDILLTDMYMPGMNGTDIIETLARNGSTPELFIFVISNSANALERETYKANPNIIFIQKPATLAEINNLPELILGHLNAGHIKRI